MEEDQEVEVNNQEGFAIEIQDEAEEESRRNLITILDIVPDCEPAHIQLLLIKNNNSVSTVLEKLLESDDYPKIKKINNGKGKKRARTVDLDDDDEEVEKKEWKMSTNWWDLSTRKESSDAYCRLALEQLYKDFDTIHKNQVKKSFHQNSDLYATTYIFLKEKLNQSEEERGYPLLKKSRNSKFNTYGMNVSNDLLSQLEKEVEDSKQKVELDEAKAAIAEVERKLDEQAEKLGLLMTCPNCYDSCRIERMIQCTENHFFCMECSIANANTQISFNRSIVPCMEADCEALFDHKELSKVLPKASISALEKLELENEIDSAGLEGLERCPFCSYSCCIENEHERLFRCEAFDVCGIVSCRQCRRPEHLPKSCEEMQSESTIHAVADAMTAALIRKCPKCSQAYLKSDGCNYITCSKCSTGSCYVCQKSCKKDQSHFEMGYLNHLQAEVAESSTSLPKCPLFDLNNDNSLQRDQKNVELAKEAAREKVLAYSSNPNTQALELEIDKLDVDVKAPPPPPNPYAPGGVFYEEARRREELEELAEVDDDLLELLAAPVRRAPPPKKKRKRAH